MNYNYVVPVQPNPSREELHWAWRFTVISRADGHCQHCGKQRRLDGCHIQSRRAHPELAFDPANGIALCRSCHMKHDTANGHKPVGRPAGFKHSAETKAKIGASNRRRYLDSAESERTRQANLAWWDRKGRKHALRNCDHCGKALTQQQSSKRGRFCSSACHYAFRRGKPKIGY